MQGMSERLRRSLLYVPASAEAMLRKADGTIAVDMDPLSLLCRLA